MDNSEEQRTIWCGNLSEKVTEELLYELFLQAGPLVKVKIPLDREGRKNSYAFITFKHAVSVPYATQLLNGISLFTRKLNLKPRTGAQQQQLQQQSHVVQSQIQIPHSTPPNMGINEINKLMFLGSMMKLDLKIPNSFDNQQPNVRRENRNYNNHKDNVRDRPYTQNYRGRNHREVYEQYRGGNNRNFYPSARQRR